MLALSVGEQVAATMSQMDEVFHVKISRRSATVLLFEKLIRETKASRFNCLKTVENTRFSLSNRKWPKVVLLLEKL